MEKVVREIRVLAAAVLDYLERGASDQCGADLRIIGDLARVVGAVPPRDARERVLYLAARRMISLAQAAERALHEGDVARSIVLVRDILAQDVDVESLLQKEREEVRAFREFVNAVPDILVKYVLPGMVVCELFHGENTDVLTMLADLVGPSGRVYGLDRLNPFADNPSMVRLALRDNVELMCAQFPLMPVPPLDALVVRELLWAYRTVQTPEQERAADVALARAVKPGGFLVLLLNKAEYASELAHGSYQSVVARWPGKWVRVSFDKHELVFQKL